jgi:trimeric autotransporter adhesin
MTKAANKKQVKEKGKPARKLKLNKKTILDLDSAGEMKGGGQSQTCNTGLRCHGGCVQNTQTCECSDRDIKDNFRSIDSQAILSELQRIVVQSWNYKTDGPSVRHIGPMAQDFAAAFGFDHDDKHIYLVDVAGVAFASIQALARQVAELQAHLDELKKPS